MFNDDDLIRRPRFAQTYHLIKEQIPDWIEDEGSNMEDFLTVYYEWLDNNVTTALSPDFADIDYVDERFVEYFVDEFAAFASEWDVGSVDDRRRLVKRAKNMYERKGTSGSFRLFFKLMFGIDPDVYFTKDDVLYLSSIDLSSRNKVNIDVSSGAYQNVSRFEELRSIEILGQKLDIVAANRFENRVEVTFNNRLIKIPEVGDLATFIFERTRVNSPIVSTVVDFNGNINDAYGFRVYDRIEVTPQLHDTLNSSAIYNVSNTSRGAIDKINIFNTGTDYHVGDYFPFSPSTSPFHLYADEVVTQEQVDDDETGELVLGSVVRVSIANGSQFYVATATEYDPVVFSVDSTPVTFNDTPSPLDYRVNDDGETINTANGTGFQFNSILPQAGRINKLSSVDNGSALSIDTVNVKSMCSFLVADPTLIAGKPVVEIQKWANDRWESTGYGGRVNTISEGGARVTIVAAYATASNGGRLRFPTPTFLSNRGNQNSTPFRIVVPQNSTGIIIQELCACYDFQLLQLSAASFDYGTISREETVNSNERQVLSSASTRIHDAEFYHEYAYFIKSPYSAVDWMVPFKDAVHPAGFRVVSEVSTFDDELLEGRTTISETFKYAQDGLYDDKELSYSFPNRVLNGVEDLNVVPRYEQGREYTGGWKIDYQYDVQYSPAFFLEINDETNVQRFEYEIDYFSFWNDIFINMPDDQYNRYQQTPTVSRVLVPERAPPVLNNVYTGDDDNEFEPGYVSSTTSADEGYYYAGWAKHSYDLYDYRHNHSIWGTPAVTPNAARFVYGSFTNYDGNFLRREKLDFPAGNTPIRYIDITKERKGVYTQEDVYINSAFPADQRGVNPLKQDTIEVNLSPDRLPYTEVDDDPYSDESLSSLQPSTRVGLKQGTMDFSIDNSVNLQFDPETGEEVGGIQDDLNEILGTYDNYGNFTPGDEEWITEGYFGDSWWSYEPMGVPFDDTIPSSPTNINVTQREEETDTTSVRHYYTRYVGDRLKNIDISENQDGTRWRLEDTQPKHKDDSWYEAEDWGVGIAGIEVEQPDLTIDPIAPYNTYFLPYIDEPPVVVNEPAFVEVPVLDVIEPVALGQPTYQNLDGSDPDVANGEISDAVYQWENGVDSQADYLLALEPYFNTFELNNGVPFYGDPVIPETGDIDTGTWLFIPVFIEQPNTGDYPNLVFVGVTAQQPTMVIEPTEPTPVPNPGPEPDPNDYPTQEAYQEAYIVWADETSLWNQYQIEYAQYLEDLNDYNEYIQATIEYDEYTALLQEYNTFRLVNTKRMNDYIQYVNDYNIQREEFDTANAQYQIDLAARAQYDEDLQEYEDYLDAQYEYDIRLANYEDDTLGFIKAILQEAGIDYEVIDGIVYDANDPSIIYEYYLPESKVVIQGMTSPIGGYTQYQIWYDASVANFPAKMANYEATMEIYTAESVDYRNWYYTANPDAARVVGDDIDLSSYGSGIRKVILEDTTTINRDNGTELSEPVLTEYNRMTEIEISDTPYIKFDDERKVKYSAVVYPEDYTSVFEFDGVNQALQRERPRQNQVFLLKDFDLIKAIDGTLTYTTYVPNRTELYTFTGDEAFSAKWQKVGDE